VLEIGLRKNPWPSKRELIAESQVRGLPLGKFNRHVFLHNLHAQRLAERS
jgi:hypothetical protein